MPAKKPEPGYEGLNYLLKPQAGGTVGPEKVSAISDDVNLYIDGTGSHRYVKTVGGKPVAALQVMVKGGEGHVANVFTAAPHRGQGYASELLGHARKRLSKIVFSADRSAAGRAWVGAVKQKGDER